MKDILARRAQLRDGAPGADLAALISQQALLAEHQGGFFAVALRMEQARHARYRSELEQLRALVTRHVNRPTEATLRRVSVPG